MPGLRSVTGISSSRSLKEPTASASSLVMLSRWVGGWVDAVSRLCGAVVGWRRYGASKPPALKAPAFVPRHYTRHGIHAHAPKHQHALVGGCAEATEGADGKLAHGRLHGVVDQRDAAHLRHVLLVSVVLRCDVVSVGEGRMAC